MATQITEQPVILAVDDDGQVLRAVVRDLRNRYRQEYRILSTEKPQEAIDTARELKARGQPLALVLSDQRMPGMLGVDVLQQIREISPDTRRVLLTAYSDTEAAIRAINDVQLHYYLVKPWDPPEENLYPVLDDLLADWQMGFVPPYRGIRLIGYPFSPKSHRLKDYLSGNLLPYQWLDASAQPEAQELLALKGLTDKDLPVLVFEDGSALADPELPAIALQLGRSPEAKEELYDVVIVGAGPAGLAAAVYGGSEGLRTLLIERRAPGGQAGTSSRIENYLGFPAGLSGAELSRRAIAQAERFGVEFLSPQTVTTLQLHEPYKTLHLADGAQVVTRAVVLAMGVDYRKLEAPGLEELSGAGVYYGAANTEASSCRNREVYIVGGGNSAGQAAMYLSRYAATVHILVRSEGLKATMSQYLIDQLASTPNVVLHPHTEVVAALGQDHLECLVIKEGNGQEQTVQAASLFIFIGAKPATDWLGQAVLRDARGYLLTGRELMATPEYKHHWKHRREPYLLETSAPGVLAAGDIRAGAMARVASAVGEGAMAIRFVHQYLAEN